MRNEPLRLAGRAEMALVRMFGKRYVVEESGFVVDYYVWRGRFYYNDIIDTRRAPSSTGES